MREIKGNIRSEIISKYSTLDPEKLYWKEAEQFYRGYNISTFDHYLSEEEANKHIIFYSKDMSKELKSKYNEIENRYLNSIKTLNTSSSIVLCEYEFVETDKDALFHEKCIKLFEFENEKEIGNVFIKGLREENKFTFLIPNISSILLSDYDLELVLFCADNFMIDILYKAFKKEGFYLLEHKIN